MNFDPAPNRTSSRSLVKSSDLEFERSNFESNLELENFSDLSNVRFLFSAYERVTTLLSIAWRHTALTVSATNEN